MTVCGVGRESSIIVVVHAGSSKAIEFKGESNLMHSARDR